MSNSERHVVMIAQEGCPPCEAMKDFLSIKGIEFDVIYIGEKYHQLSPELFKILWPNNTGTPHVIIDQRVCRDPYSFFDLDF